MQQLPRERLLIAVGAAATMQRAIDETLAYVAQRQVFGEPLLAMQNTRFKLAECETAGARCAQTFVDDCIERLLAGTLDVPTAAMAKWWTTDKLCRVVDECLQLHGGYGYMNEYPIARMYADARVLPHLRRCQRGDEGAHRPRAMERKAHEPPQWARPQQATVRSPHFRFWPKGVARELVVPQATLPECLELAARRYPDKAALVYCGSVMSYAELRQAEALAGWLQRHAARRSAATACCCVSQNCPQFVVARYAILRADAVVVPVNRDVARPTRCAHIVDDSGARVAFVAQELAAACAEPRARRAARRASCIAYADALTADSDSTSAGLGRRAAARRSREPRFTRWATRWRPATAPRRHRAPDDLAVLPYTSGTTGRPKGCMHTPRARCRRPTAPRPCWRGLH